LTGGGFIIDANAVAGFSAFSAAGAACARVAMRGSRARALWSGLGVVHTLWAIEILLDLRYRWRGVLIPLLQARGWYASRTGWQEGAIVVALMMGATLVFVAWRRHRHDAPVLGALAGTVLAVMLLAVETVSLHRIDALMYAEAGPLVVLAWLWIGSAAIVVASAWASHGRLPFRAGSGARAATHGDAG
jgi:hypothetical protein